MNSRSFNSIFILLSICVLSMLGLQGYWIRNQYYQASKEFDSSVYSALDELSLKLKERKKLQAFKMTYVIQNGDTVARTPSRVMTISTDDKTMVVNEHNKVRTKKLVSLKRAKTTAVKDCVKISGQGTNVYILLNDKKAKAVSEDVMEDLRKMEETSGLLERDVETIAQHSTILKKEAGGMKQQGNVLDPEMTKIIDKMITEIKVLDMETESPDTLKALIKRTLQNKGLFLPFEFAIEKLNGAKEEVSAHSAAFSKQNPFYRSDLSSADIIRKNEFLMLQFPGRRDFVMAGMKSSLILSLLFSLVILSIFYYVMRLILRQKKLSEIKNDFVNNMTHELKTPIATISLALDAINNPIVRNDDSKFTDYSRILKEENQKLNAHVEKVLQIALLDKGELELNRREVDLAEIISASLATFKLQIAEQKADVQFNPSESVIFSGDEQHLKAVFTNLIDNALKYSGEACVIRITIQTTGETICVRITDNGIGIDGDQQKRVFDKFYRVQGGNLHDVKGFGLGLSYVRSIVEAHGGVIELKSEPGKGSEFIFLFKK